MGYTVGLENNSGERVLNSLKFMCDIMRCAIENRISVVETGADESMSNKRCSVRVETVSDVSESLQVIVARLGDLVGMFIESERLV